MADSSAEARGVRGDFTGDGRADLAVYRPSTGQWFIRGLDAVTWGLPSDIPVPGDYDGDGTSDIAVYRRATGQWFVRGLSAIVWGALGDIPVPADYDGDGRTDVAVFRPATGQWIIFAQPPLTLGAAQTGDIPVQGDYAGLGRAQPAVYRRASGTWLIRGLAPIAWGVAGDIPVPADYDGDGTTDVAVYRPSTREWFVRNLLYALGVHFGSSFTASLGYLPIPQDLDGDGRAELVRYDRTQGVWQTSNTFLYDTDTDGRTTVKWGAPGDLPVLAGRFQRAILCDFDGDQLIDITQYSNSARLEGYPGGDWSIIRSGGGFESGFWGTGLDVPVPGDYLGFGKSQVAVFRDGQWLVAVSQPGCSLCTPTLFFPWGARGDIPVPADYDGDGRTDPGVFRSGTWFVLLSSTAFTRSAAFTWGSLGDVALPGDYDGDGRADPATFRGGTWRILLSSSDYMTSRTYSWGTTGDVAVPSDYDGDVVLDIAVFRPADGVWYVRRSSDGATLSQVWGRPLDGMTSVPVTGDYDGDGKTDFTVAYVPPPNIGWAEEWWVLFSGASYSSSTRIGVPGPPWGDPLPTRP